MSLADVAIAAKAAISINSINGMSGRILGRMKPNTLKKNFDNAGARGRIERRFEFMVKLYHSTKSTVLSVVTTRPALSLKVCIDYLLLFPF